MKKQNISANPGHKILAGVLCLLAINMFYNVFGSVMWAQKATQKKVTKIEAKKPSRVNHKIAPQIPGVNRYQKNKVFIEHADVLSTSEYTPDYQILHGNVQFRKGGTFMYCDSAHFYEKTSSLDAFGHVKIRQGDTLQVDADVLYYSGDMELAQLRYNVRMENKDVTLFTDSLDYDMANKIGFYFEGGKIVDSKNELSSVYGQYETDTKHAEFLYDVELVNEKYVMKTDTLHYNTNTHIADIVGKTTIVSDSSIIYSRNGWYNTEKDSAMLFERSLIKGKGGQSLTGDTLMYDKKKGIGEAKGNIVLIDSVKKSILDGGYGFYNEIENMSYATIRARAREFSSGDTLYLHGDTLRTQTFADSTRLLTAYPAVRFYRKDFQGVCDSMSVVERDSMMNMYKHAVLWSDERQISGNVINAHMRDSLVEWAKLPDFGFMAEHIGEIYYNQLSGKEMFAQFIDNELRQLDVSGNVYTLLFPMEEDSTYNKLVTTESSFLVLKLKPKQEMEKLTMWPDVTGDAIPLFLAKRPNLYLLGFKWHGNIRPQGPDDIYNVSEEMREMLNSEVTSTRRRKKSN